MINLVNQSLLIAVLLAALSLFPASAPPTSGPATPLSSSIEWATKAEATGFRATPRYHETVQYCRRLAEASPWIDVQSFGRSPEGRELLLVVASRDRAFTPEAARSSGKLVVLVQNCIHAGECAGKDASLMILRDLAVTKTRPELLEHVILLVMPMFNVDGHERFGPYSRINQNGPAEMGWRTTSRNLNLNRDYLKADAVEMRAWLQVWNIWQPDLFIDHHTTDGADWQYDFLYAVDRHGAVAPPVVEWTKAHLGAGLTEMLEKDGHVVAPYIGLVDWADPTKGVRAGGFGPRFSTGYAAVRNRPGILVESHMIKPYRVQVMGHYDLMLRVLEDLNRDPQPLRAAVRAADEATVKIGERYDPAARLAVAIGPTDESVPFVLRWFAFRRELSEISGSLRILWDNTQPMDIPTVLYDGSKVTQTVNPPLAYLIPAQWTEAVELARAHGLRCARLTAPVTGEFESYRFTDVTFAKASYEGRVQVAFKTVPLRESRTFLAGSVVVPLNHPAAKAAVHLFEPATPDSLVTWGFFNAIFEQKEYAEDYVLEKLAREMLAADPKLRAEFETRIAADREFAADSRARLYFFYERSPYYDQAKNVYPIARVTRPLEVSTEPM